jgi:hypothetical protein
MSRVPIVLFSFTWRKHNASLHRGRLGHIKALPFGFGTHGYDATGLPIEPIPVVVILMRLGHASRESREEIAPWPDCSDDVAARHVHGRNVVAAAPQAMPISQPV